MTIQIGSKLALAGLALIGAAVITPAQAATNTAPTISGTPVTSVVAGQAYSFQPTARDADGNFLVFSVTSKPSWARLDWVTGRLYGTPTTAQVGVYEQITISVTDFRARTSLATFSITVKPNSVGQAPTISGTPVTSATVNQAYSFKPTAFDMDGDALTFAVTNKPTWATFNTATGQLTGTPAQTGVYSNVQISVSDGTKQATLPAFAITVNPAAAPAPVTKSVALNWLPPTQNTDGTALTTLAGYRIVYGTESGKYTQSVSVNGSGLSSYTIENLAAGKYFFALVVRDASGAESAPSSEVSVTL